MLVYNYSRDNFIFSGSIEGRESPLEPGVTLIPAYATSVAPPTPTTGDEVAVFTEGLDIWSLQPSFIGQVGYDKITKEEITITTLGDWPDGITPLQPLAEADEWNETSSQWETPLIKTQWFCKLNIDAAAESARRRYLTGGSGQALTYQEKSEEATDYVAAGYPANLTSYPFIQAEVNATGKTSTQAADDILTQRSAWIMVGAAVEEARIGGKGEVDAAAGNATIMEAARDATIAILDAI